MRSFEKEFLFYRRLCDRLGKDAQRFQNERDRLAQEVRLHQIQVRFERELSHSAASSADIAQLTERVLEAIAQHVVCTKALILASVEGSVGDFQIVASFGLLEGKLDDKAKSSIISLRTIPALLTIRCEKGSATDGCRSLAPLINILGDGPLIWEYDEESGYAVAILGTSGLGEDLFIQQGEDLTHIALSGLLHGLWRLRGNRLIASQNVATEVTTPKGAELAKNEQAEPPRSDPDHPYIREADIVAGIRDGGSILDAVVFALQSGEYRLELFPSWARGFQRVITYRSTNDKTYKDFNRLLAFLRENCSYHDKILVLPEDKHEDSPPRFIGRTPAKTLASVKSVGIA
ncbi:hypothetical protein WDZ11_22450 (plasmid) [Roseomonas mucosa]|uniref:hypothetical protein n=1 Tax=Roseomonas mucosa TaxID=207340 RepID=UPI0030CD0919